MKFNQVLSDGAVLAAFASDLCTTNRHAILRNLSRSQRDELNSRPDVATVGRENQPSLTNQGKKRWEHSEQAENASIAEVE